MPEHDATEKAPVSDVPAAMPPLPKPPSCTRCEAEAVPLNAEGICENCEIRGAVPAPHALVWSDESHRKRLRLGSLLAQAATVGQGVRLIGCLIAVLVAAGSQSRPLVYAVAFSESSSWACLISLALGLVFLAGKESRSDHKPGWRRPVVWIAVLVVGCVQAALTFVNVFMVAGPGGDASGDEAAFFVGTLGGAGLFNLLVVAGSPLIVWVVDRTEHPEIPPLAARLGVATFIFTVIGSVFVGLGLVWPLFWMHATFRRLRHAIHDASRKAASMA